MSNQYDVLGKAPEPQDLKKLSPDNNHLTIKNCLLVMVKWKYFMILI